MKELTLLILEFNYDQELKSIINSLKETLHCEIIFERLENIDTSEFYSAERKQFNAGTIINNLCQPEISNQQIILTSLDLYIPIFTYVFGLAKLNGSCAIVSTHRLGNRFYGLPSNRPLFKERIVKEIVHELGHLLGLRHCENYQCVMNSSTSVDDLDTKEMYYCSACSSLL